MAHNFRLAVTTIDTELQAVCQLLDDGYLRIYGGNQPRDGSALIRDEQLILLAELRFDNPAFRTPAAGMAVANGILPELSAKAEGKATWFRCFRWDGTTPVFDGSIGTRDADLVLDDVVVYFGRQVHVNRFVYSKRLS